jgi:hypothetical protein
MFTVPRRNVRTVTPARNLRRLRAVAPLALLATVLVVAGRERLDPRNSSRPAAESPSQLTREAAHVPPGMNAPVRPAAAIAPPDRPTGRHGSSDVAAGPTAAALLADAAAARREGDLRTTLSLLQLAFERAPSVATHAALGAFYLELGASRAAEKHLRAATEGDPATADRWIALANALTLKPDPLAAAAALDRARSAEPGLRVTRDPGGWLVREPEPAS